MKKILMLLPAALLLCGSALAEDAVLTPVHGMSMENYGTEECTLSANFDTADAVDDQGRMTYTVSLPDLYDADQVRALKPGDAFIAFGQEMKAETISTENGAVCVNGDSGVYFETGRDTNGMMVCNDYTETISSEQMGPYTFPLADPVRLVTYRMDADGNLLEGMDEQSLTPAEARSFLEAHSDMDRPDYLSAFGSATKVSVKDGQVTEIVIDWSSDS